ncbi:unnamed protein product [Vitrella brassicaformis CCMP3155]|uniref:C3H1-type domain-containing protein n=1 Tax=Vitrella brassicaformis (strain CCMP3155) TaxID=1169540 RepID=A0A0G4EZ06_VITBC|nr:unnamed protein product [Vitrella brassicaformis CCMP3155]|eukprot:CEM04423.1 unnamed protein product [Vitrella brassicaformis CCMP3155]
MAHTEEEIYFHPLTYKTRVCPSRSCSRKHCPFIHGFAEERRDMRYLMRFEAFDDAGLPYPPMATLTIHTDGTTMLQLSATPAHPPLLDLVQQQQHRHITTHNKAPVVVGDTGGAPDEGDEMGTTGECVSTTTASSTQSTIPPPPVLLPAGVMAPHPGLASVFPDDPQVSCQLAALFMAWDGMVDMGN